jgi:hypothetical protein
VSEGYIEDAPQSYGGESYQGQAIPVTIETDNAAPEYGGCLTWVVPQAGVGTPIPIFNRRLRRFKGKLSVVALGGATSVVFNSVIDRLQGATPQGYTVLAVGALPDWESQQPLYAIGVGGTPTVSCIDESYADRETSS